MRKFLAKDDLKLSSLTQYVDEIMIVSLTKEISDENAVTALTLTAKCYTAAQAVAKWVIMETYVDLSIPVNPTLKPDQHPPSLS